jgi:hypothetical protein
MKDSKYIFLLIIILILLLLIYNKYNNEYNNEYNKKVLENYSNGLLDLLQYKGEPIKYKLENDDLDVKKDEINTKKDENNIKYKYIFLKKYDNNNLYKLFNQKYKNYLIINGRNNKFRIKTVDDKNIGYINHYKYNTYNSYFNKKNIDYTILYNDKKLIKIFYNNDTYYINNTKKKNNYTISLYLLNIGEIKKININTYKITIEEQYKNILNIISFGLIIELLRN